MGEGTDQLRQEVDQKRDDAAQKIDQIEQQVMQTAQQMEQKVTDTAQQIEHKVMDTRQQIEDKVVGTIHQVTDKIDWRGQVENRPLVAVGVALLGGALLGGILKGGDGSDASAPGGARQSGVGNAIRNAARESGLEDTIQTFAQSAMSRLGDEVRSATERSFPGVADMLGQKSESMRSTSGASSFSS